VPSGGGVFEVSVNGVKVHSKQETGDFPDFDAVVAAIKKKL
jgi:selT/selW/selH-like putative selenoprotein